MKRLPLWVVLFVLSVAPAAFGQATRTWVSGVGDDANPCSRTAPCKTFAGAISKTAAGGEISVLDPGGYGAVTITKSITINGAGTLASILFAGASAGVIINGAGIVVHLTDLSLNGGTSVSPGTNGIRIVAAGHVSVVNCDIFNYLTNGIVDNRSTAGTLTVSNTRIHNSFGAAGASFGIQVAPTAGTPANKLSVDNSLIFRNSGTGIFVANGTRAMISKSVIHSNQRGVAVVVTAGTAEATIEDTQIFNNSEDGVRVTANGTARLSTCAIYNNTLNGTNNLGGVIGTFENNRIAGNGGNNGTGLTLLGNQ